jgi:hypothetical protein
MTDEQLKALLTEYMNQLLYTGACEANLPQSDFEAMRDYIKSKNFTTTESNADNVINVHVDGRVIKIGGY